MIHDTLAHGVAPAGFLRRIETIPFGAIARRGRVARPGDAALVTGGEPDLEEAAALLAGTAGHDTPALLRAARERTDRVFGRSVLLYAPCYLSSHCVNLCRYCGFNYAMPIPRRRLTLDEAGSELAILAGRGMRRLLLVAGEYPALVDPAYIEGAVRAAAALAPEIDLEVAPSPVRTYRQWARAGAGGVVCYQETYDRRRYAELHPKGPKRSYAVRLGTPERAAAAGMRRLGIGILLGLSDPLPDLLALIAHARYLKDLHPDIGLTVSLPRLRPAGTEFEPPYVVGDEALIRYYAVLRLALPETGLTVSTREHPGTRRRLLEAGITQMSAQSVTVPGGYAEQEQGGAQFDIADHRSVQEVVAELVSLGYTPRWTAFAGPLTGVPAPPAAGPAA